jgi:hypothetical protein
MKQNTFLILGVVLLLLVLQISTTTAQNNLPPQGTWGMRASIQGSQSDIMLPYRASGNVTISPLFGFQWNEDQFTRIRFGAHGQFFRNTGSNFASYIGGRLVIQIHSPEVGDSETDISLGGNFGGEYFLSRSFSLGVEGQLNLFLNDQTRIGTGTAVFATYYF